MRGLASPHPFLGATSGVESVGWWRVPFGFWQARDAQHHGWYGPEVLLQFVDNPVSGMCRVGFTGFYAPRVMFPSGGARPRMLCVMAGMDQKDSCSGLY